VRSPRLSRNRLLNELTYRPLGCVPNVEEEVVGVLGPTPRFGHPGCISAMLLFGGRLSASGVLCSASPSARPRTAWTDLAV